MIPIDRPIFMREVASKMYGATPYYLAMVTNSSITALIYPVIVTLTSFFFFGLEESSFSDCLDWMYIMCLMVLAGSLFGFMLGTIFESEVVATQVNGLFIIAATFGAGFFANTGEGANFVVEMLTYVSPLRYSTELFNRKVYEGKRGGDIVLERFGFTWGRDTCLLMLQLWCVTVFFIGLISIRWKTRNF